MAKNDNSKTDGISRRRFLLGSVAVAVTPSALLTRTASAPSLTASLATSAGTNPSASISASTQVIRALYENLTEQLMWREDLKDIFLIVSEEGVPSLGNSGLAVISNMFDVAFRKSSISNRILDGVIEHPKILETLATCIKHNCTNLLKSQPSINELEEFFAQIHNHPEYSKIFGADSPQTTAERLLHAIEKGESGIADWLKEIDLRQEAAMRNEPTVKTFLANLPTFRDTAAAHKVGGYPIPPGHEIAKRPLVADRSRSGEWSERIRSSKEAESQTTR